jgi:phage gpG-like protein
VILIQNDARILAPVDTGRLRNSIAHEVTASGQSVTGRTGTNVQYGPVVEYGRAAGSAMPPAGALSGWMSRHGIEASAEFAIRRSIARRGIRKRPYLKPALDKNRAAISREMDTILRKIAERLAGAR